MSAAPELAPAPVPWGPHTLPEVLALLGPDFRGGMYRCPCGCRAGYVFFIPDQPPAPPARKARR